MSIKKAFNNTRITSLESLTENLSKNYNIDSQIFEIERDGKVLKKISFKTNKIKHFVSGEHINYNLKLENLYKIIADMNNGKISSKNVNNVFRSNKIINKKNNKTKKGMVIYR